MGWLQIEPVVSGTGLTNFNITSVNGSYNIGKVSLTVAADNKGKSYDGAAFTTFTSTITGFVTGENSSVVSGTPGYSGTAVGAVNAGSYTITPTLGTLSATNYNFNSFNNGALTISKAAVTATGGSGTATYDGTTKSPSACVVTGIYKGDLTCANTPSSVGPNAGTTAIVPQVSGTGLTNFEITSVNGTAVINAAATTTVITCPTTGVTFNGAAQTPCSATVTGANGLNEAVAVTYANNVNAGTATANAAYTASTNYAASTAVEKTFTISKALVTATAGGGAATYDGSAKTPSACAVTGVYKGDLTCANDVTSVGPDAGTAIIKPVVSGTGLTNFNITPVNGSYTIDPASSSTVVTCPTTSVTFNGVAQTPCTVSVTGAGGLNLTPNAVYSDNTNAGTATASYNFAGGNNHTSSNDSKTFTIDKAGSTTTVTCTGTPIFTGSAITPCSVSVTGVGGLNLTPTPVYANNVNATTVGNLASASYTFNGDANHTGSSDNETFSIGKAGSTVTVTCPTSFEYPGLASTPCTATVTGAGGLNLPLPVSYLNNTSAGTATANASYAGGNNHTGNSNSKTFVIMPRPALVRYIGQTQFVTSGTSSTTAQVTLSASVQDPTGVALNGAKAEFIDFTNGLPGRVLASNVNVSPVAGSGANTGTANTIVTLSTGQYGAESYLILVRLTGPYTNALLSDPDAFVSVVKPAGTNEANAYQEITGMASAAGLYRSNVDEKIRFVLGMKYNSSGTNPQGKITVSIPQPDGSTVLIKSNSISSMAITPFPGGKKATIYTKSNVSKILANGTAVAGEGNVSLRMDVTDNSSGSDEVGFTAMSSSNSQLFYSNNWVADATGWKTVTQVISSGKAEVK